MEDESVSKVSVMQNKDPSSMSQKHAKRWAWWCAFNLRAGKKSRENSSSSKASQPNKTGKLQVLKRYSVFKIRWEVPEEWHPRCSSHTHTHICTQIPHICIPNNWTYIHLYTRTQKTRRIFCCLNNYVAIGYGRLMEVLPQERCISLCIINRLSQDWLGRRRGWFPSWYKNMPEEERFKNTERHSRT